MQAHPGACDSGRIRSAKISLKESLAISCGNSYAMIAHLHDELALVLPGIHIDRTAGRRVFDRIGDQIAEGMKQQFRITVDGCRQVLEVFRDVYTSIGLTVRLASVT